MIRIKATGFPQFLAAHATLRAAGVAVTASGGNEMRVPDDTDREVLRAVAATGAVVHADLTEPNPDPTDVPPSDPAGQPPASPDELPPGAGDAAASTSAEAPDTESPVDTPPETTTSASSPTRAPRKTTTRRKTAKE